MARTLCTTCLIAGLAALGAPSAEAQFFNPFEALFGTPPRPPSGVPGGRAPTPPAPQERAYPGQPYPPSGGAGDIHSQPLPPPGSSAAADPRAPLGALPPGQRPQRGAPADTSPQPGDEIIADLPSQKINNKGALFSGLDKITGRIHNFDVAIGETVQFGALQVTPRVCYTRPPTETSNTDAFIEVDEVTLQGEVKRIFTGWVFASSPGLHAVEHPIYDVWLTDCKQPEVAAIAPPEPAAAPPPPAARQPAARRPSQQPTPQANVPRR